MLKIKDFGFSPLSNSKKGFGLEARLEERTEKLTQLIDDDIKQITKGSLAKIKSTSDILNPLHRLRKAVGALPETLAKAKIMKFFKFLLLAIETHLNDITTDNKEISKFLSETYAAVGRIPTLNEEVAVAHEKHLPRMYKKTVSKWSKIKWKNPNRNSKTEPLSFFSRQEGEHSISSVRLHLLEEDRAVNQTIDDSKLKATKALSYADADFYSAGDLQADHFQSSSDIVLRQLILIEAMNLIPKFAKKVISSSPNGDKYFIKENNLFFGTKFFFMQYHNCIDNLWLISTAANTGAGKGNSDCIEWLDNHALFGETFFKDIGGKNFINYDHILYTTREDVILAKAAKQWFLRKYKSEIFTSGFILDKIKNPVSQLIQQSKESGSKRKQVRAIAKIAIVDKALQKTPPKAKKRKGEPENQANSEKTSKRAKKEIGKPLGKKPPQQLAFLYSASKAASPSGKHTESDTDSVTMSSSDDDLYEISTPDRQVNKDSIKRAKGVLDKSPVSGKMQSLIRAVSRGYCKGVKKLKFK